MGNFDIVESGFSNADETINFGTRCLADNDQLHETVTLAVLKNSDVSDDEGTLTVNSSLRVFNDKECTNVIFNVTFDAIIDTICICRDAKFLLITLRNETIYILHIDDGYTCIFEENLNNSQGFLNCYTHKLDDNDTEFWLLSNAGIIYRLQTGVERFIVQEFYNFDSKPIISAFFYPKICTLGDELSVLNVENSDEITNEKVSIERIYSLTPYMFLALQESGKFIRICNETLLYFEIDHEQEFKDFMLVTDIHDRHIIGVTENLIQLLHYPVMPESINDEVFYISKIKSGNEISELRICMIYESKPIKRLERLLKKQKFDEAEQFATLFNLDLDQVKKARAERITHKQNCDKNDIDNLIKILNDIADDEFKLECCIDVVFSSDSADDVRRILNYGCTLPIKTFVDISNIAEKQTTLSTISYRFETFLSVYDKYETADWMEFVDFDFLHLLKQYLENAQIEEAIIIFSRLDQNCLINFNLNDVDEILHILNKLSMEISEPFLYTFIPLTLTILPQSLSLFIDWLKHRIFFMERNHRSISSVVLFTEKTLRLFKIDDNKVSLRARCLLNPEDFNGVEDILTALKNLEEIEEKYHVKIPINDFFQEPKIVVRTILNLISIPRDCYDALLQNFLLNFINEHNLDPNEILLEEVTEMVKYEERYWIDSINSILKCLSSIEIKLKILTVILRSAPLPWSQSVRNLAKSGLKYEHSLADEIEKIITSEPVYLVLNNPKYGFKEGGNIRDIYHLRFLINRIMYCNESSMIDDVFTISKDPKFRHEALMMLINHFIRIGNLNQALDLLDQNEPEEKQECMMELWQFIIGAVNNELKLNQLRDNYYQIAECIYNRLVLNASKLDTLYIKMDFDSLKIVYNLNKYFGQSVSTYDVNRIGFKDGIIESVLADLINDLENGVEEMPEIISRATKLAKCLSLPEDQIFIRLCESTKSFDLILKSARLFIANDTQDSKNLCRMSALILKYFGVQNAKVVEESSGLDDSIANIEGPSPTSEHQKCFDGLQLAKQLVAKAVTFDGNDDDNDKEAILQITHWVSTAFCVNCDNSAPSMLVFNAIGNVFNLYCQFIGEYKVPSTEYLTRIHGSRVNENEFVSTILSYSSMLKSLCRENQHDTAYRLLRTLQVQLVIIPDLLPKIHNQVSHMLNMFAAPNLLENLIREKKIDSNMIFNLLICWTPKNMADFLIRKLRLYKREPQKLRDLSKVALKLWRYFNIPDPSNFEKSVLSVKWWEKLNKSAVNYDQFFKSKADQRLEMIMQFSNNIKFLNEYCIDFELEPQNHYLIYLKQTIKSWKPIVEIKYDLKYGKLLKIKNDEKILYQQCWEIVEFIEDQNSVVETINKLWLKTNFYHYEVFITMFNLLSKLNNRKSAEILQMLQFLKKYRRQSTPNENETENWFTTFPDSQQLDALSEFRLPFTNMLFTPQIWGFIKSEISLKSYKLWFHVPHLSRDEICCNALNRIVSSDILRSGQIGSEQNWVLRPKLKHLFDEIDKCADFMQDMDRATAALNNVTHNTPAGADQVTAAKLCYKYAKRIKQSQNFLILQKRYYNIAALHILHVYKLVEERYVKLALQPNDLIVALYSDERIVTNSCPNINGAVRELAELFKVDLDKLQHAIINDWLETDDCDLNSSNIFNERDRFVIEDSLKRYVYICSSGDLEVWRKHLFNIGFNDQISLASKAKVLKLCVSISDETSIVGLLQSCVYENITYEGFLNYIDKLILSSNLHLLGISLGIEDLDQMNKIELLNRLRAGRGDNPLSIKTMAIICITYQIYKMKYWDHIINSTIQMALWAELNAYIQYLKKIEKFRLKSFNIRGWQKIIDHSFSTISSNEKQMFDDLLDKFLMIQSCPVLYSLKLEYVLEKCLHLHKFEFAAVLLQYIPHSNELVQEIKRHEGLSEKLNNLQRHGIVGIEKVKNILNIG